VAIVGAGAAGLATAIFLRRADPAIRVVLLEGARRPGAKILVSGGSRCNVTNTVVTDADFWGGPRSIVRRVLRGFTVSETIAFFRELGVELHEEPDGKLFPNSNRSRDVLDALLRESLAQGVLLLSGHRVTNVLRTADGFGLDTTHGRLLADAVVLATGGRSLPKSGSDGAGYDFAARLGHTIVATTPGLVPLTIQDGAGMHRELSGVAHDAELAVWVGGRVEIRLRGSLLWTHFGISGPLALNASRHWLRGERNGAPAALTVSFCPGSSLDAVDRRLQAAGTSRPKLSVDVALGPSQGSLGLPASVARAVTSRLGIDGRTPLSQLPRPERRRLGQALTEWKLAVSGTRGYNYAEVTAGGVALTEIEPATMESRICRRLYLVGEVLDVDGRIGGFNFQWAWSSARAAARGLSKRQV
jgi:predicted Rossmann fold flavoprotein